MRFSKIKSTLFNSKIGVYFDIPLRSLVIMFKETRYYIFF